MIEGLRKEGMAPAPVVGDAGYGNASEFREGVTRLGITWWEEGSRGPMTSRFTVLRVRSAHRAEHQTRVPPLEWLLIEWPEGEPEPTHYWFSTLPASTPVPELIRMAKLRWRIERGYQVLKDQLGMDHFEGRTWRGFHHHCSLAIAA